MKRHVQNRRNDNGGYIIGHAAFAKISAVEGINLTGEMYKDLQMFEEEGISPQDRREVIAKKYGH